LFCIAFTAPLAALLGSAHFQYTDTTASTPIPSDWGNNTNIMAACSQKQTTSMRNGYTTAFLKELRKPSAHSLGQAQNNLEESGYYDRNLKRMQYPVSSSQLSEVIIHQTTPGEEVKRTPNICLNTWSKTDNPKKNFALLIGDATRSPLESLTLAQV
jgi:hypothetical protein